MSILLGVFCFFGFLGVLIWCYFAPMVDTAARFGSEIEKAKKEKDLMDDIEKFQKENYPNGIPRKKHYEDTNSYSQKEAPGMCPPQDEAPGMRAPGQYW